MVLHFQICSDAAWTGKDKLAVSFLFALALPSPFRADASAVVERQEGNEPLSLR